MRPDTEKNQRVVDALNALRQDDGRIMPEDVVAAARSARSPLHSHFEWDDTAAAQQYRLEQARYLLRVVVTTVPHTTTQVRAFVSLSNETGYRQTLNVMVNKDFRAQLLEDAYKDMERFRLKYQHLQELRGVIAAMTRLQKKPAKKRRSA